MVTRNKSGVLLQSAFRAFIGANHDPVLSNLDGTKPGEITWDKQFLVRVLFYGLIPLLALWERSFARV